MIDGSKQYISDFDEAERQSGSAQELVDRMMVLHGDRGNPCAMTRNTGVVHSRMVTWADPAPIFAPAAEMNGREYIRAIFEGPLPPRLIAQTGSGSVSKIHRA